MKKYAGFVYEWTNKITGMKYIGSHCGLETDKYIGSGNLFKQDLKQYGMLNYERRILEYVDEDCNIKSSEDEWLEKVDAKNNPMYFNRSNKSSQFKRKKQTSVQSIRPICLSCSQKPRAVAYTKSDGTAQYRRLCEHCIKRKRRIKPPEPRWKGTGYRKKDTCDRCGFKSKHSVQLMVCHVDGNLNNNSLRNLRTVCQNCVALLSKQDSLWRPGDLEPDV